MRIRAIAVAICIVVLGSGSVAAAQFDADAILAQAKAKYAALHAYTDSGTLVTTYRSPGAPAIVERFGFTTAYAPPRRFLFDFRRDPKFGAKRFVIWANGEEFNTWWSDSKVHDTYPQGQGATAFAMGSQPTDGAVLAIAPLLFAKAGLHGALTDVAQVKGSGVEAVDGHPCYKLTGTFGLAYGTGNVRGARAETIWIDTQILLVRKLFQDTPEGTGGNIVSQIAVDFNPKENPQIPANAFTPAIPAN